MEVERCVLIVSAVASVFELLVKMLVLHCKLEIERDRKSVV